MGTRREPERLGAVEREEAAQELGLTLAQLQRMIQLGDILTCRSATRRHKVPLSEIQRIRPILARRRRQD